MQLTKNFLKICVIPLVISFFSTQLKAQLMQDVYVVCNIGGVYKYDNGAWTTFCATSTAFGDLAVSPDGTTIFGITYTTTPNTLYASSTTNCNFVVLGSYNVQLPAALSSLSDGRLLMSDFNGPIWIVNPDGSGFAQWGTAPVGWRAIGDFVVIGNTLYGAFHDSSGGGGGSRLWAMPIGPTNLPAGAWVNVMPINANSTGLAQDCDGNLVAPNGTTGTYDIHDVNTGTTTSSGIPHNCAFVWGLGSSCDGGSNCTLTTEIPLFGTNQPAIPILTNTCPQATVSLLSLNSSIINLPAGASVSWHTADPPTTANTVPNPAAVAGGVFYVTFAGSAVNCYSGTAPVLVNAIPCSVCGLCEDAQLNNVDICTVIGGSINHPLANIDCDEGGINNNIECQNNGNVFDPADDCAIALLANVNICAIINNNADHPLADKDCDNGGIPNLLECQNGGDPSDPADECAVAMSGFLNICQIIDYNTAHPMANLDCDGGGIKNYIECINGTNANNSNDDCKAAARSNLNIICLLLNNNPNHPWASLDCDDGGIINIVECMNGANPSKPSDDLFCPPNLCAEAIVGDLDICIELSNDPNHPVGPLDCDEDGVTNADECTDGTDPLDPCDFVDTSITLPVTADQSDCPFPCPDLTPITTILPGNIAGMSTVEAAIQITELENVATDGSLVIVRMPSDPRLLFVWNIGLTQAALVPVQNADWNYLGDNGFVHTWTYNGPGLIIPANGVSAFGFQSFYDPQSTDGQTTLTATVLPFSGGECNPMNNTDSERLVYFD